MAGPTCRVFLPDPPGTDVQQAVDRAVRRAGWNDPDCLCTEIWGVGSGDALMEPGELAQITAVLGWTPLTGVNCISMLNRPEYHRLLATGALCIAEEARGVIDLCGTPHVGFAGNGLQVAITYSTALGQQAEYWIVDSTWLKEWMEHPSFAMVK